MWDLDGLVSVNDLELNYSDISLLISLYQSHLENREDFVRYRFLGQLCEFTTTEEIYEKIGLYSISSNFNFESNSCDIILTGNTDMFKYYPILTFYYRLNENSLKGIRVYFNIIGLGRGWGESEVKKYGKKDKNHVLEILFLTRLLESNRLNLSCPDLTLSMFFNDLLDVNIPYNGNPHLLYVVLSRYNIDLNLLPPIKLYVKYLDDDISNYKYATSTPLPLFYYSIFSLYQFSLKYQVNIFIDINDYDYIDINFYSFISSCPNVHLFLSDTRWERWGIKDGDNLINSGGILIGHRKGNELIVTYSSDFFMNFLSSDNYLLLMGVS